MTPANIAKLRPLLLLFIGSGCAALIYEIVWFQLLQLVIGLTNLSLGLLLGTFMGGMCLGSLFLPRFVSRDVHPLKVYAFLEIGIAVIGIAILFILPALAEFYTFAHGAVLVRAIIAIICLLPPTILMGATLPVIARCIPTEKLGVFYAGNILGAVVGCLLAGFYLLRVFDMATATYVAAILNVAVAALAFLLVPRSSYTPAVEEKSDVSADRAIYIAIALSGFGALGAEVVWTRLLSMILGGTVYTFSLILAVFLFGLGLGSNIASLLRIDRPRFAFAVCQGLLLLACGWSAYAIAVSLPNWPVNPALSSTPWFNFQMDIARCMWAILPATILWGASFPLALNCVAASREDSARLVGRMYAANTVGAIAGALMFALLIIPAIGTQNSQRALIFIPAIAALILAPRLIPGLAVAALIATAIPAIPWGVAAYGRYYATYARKIQDKEIACEYIGEGMNGTVVVTKIEDGSRNFHSAGKIQASNDPRDMRLQRLLGHISALAHPNPESVLVVACGAGVTAGTFTQHPETKRIVICDIEKLVPQQVAPRFGLENFNVVKDPRTQVVSDDGRHFIRTTKEKFDIITSDPIDPWFKGCAALNTEEYYEMCKAHLKPGGVMSLWLPLYECDETAAKSLIATFFKVFPNGIMWANDDEDGLGYDAVLFAQVEPTRIDMDQLQTRLDRPDYAAVRNSLKEVGLHTAISLLSTYAGQASDLKEWTRDAQINTDSALRLQYLAGLSLNKYHEAQIRDNIGKFYRFPENIFTGTSDRREALRVQLHSMHKVALRQ